MADRRGHYAVHTDEGSVNFHMQSDQETMMTGGSFVGTSRLILALFALIGVVACVALILAAVGLTKHSSMTFNVGDSANTKGDDEKIWTFAIGHDGSRLEYIDETGGLRGFHVDTINAVCEIANKDCRLMFDIYARCWESEAGHWPRIGEGLADRWYDACTGWYATYERLRTVDFTDAFRKSVAASFFVKNGNPKNFNWQDITGKKIAIGDGYASDEFCIKRNSDKITGAVLESDQMVHYPTTEAAEQAVLNEEVDAAFMNVNIFAGTSLTKIGDEITNCLKDGGAMMTRKDSSLASWWNPAFARLKETSQFKRICDDADKNHGHMPGPIQCVD